MNVQMNAQAKQEFQGARQWTDRRSRNHRRNRSNSALVEELTAQLRKLTAKMDPAFVAACRREEAA